MDNIEIMAPVGSFESLSTAINAGADSVYFGIGSLNMRAHAAKKLSIDDLKTIVDTCKEHKIKSYLTVNTIIYDEDLGSMKQLLEKAKEADITAVIVTDIAAMQAARELGLKIHASTQLNISNIESVKYFAKFVDVIVLARELTLDQIANICKQIKTQDIKGPSGNQIKIEVFIHGALCVAIAGKCYMSLAQYNKSANRGECLHTCRRSYIVTDDETQDELKIDNRYVMSPKDLCTIGIIDRLIQAGIKIFKIEGRGRPPEYVDTTVKVYKAAIQSVKDKTYSKDKITAWEKELKTVFNRGFWKNGYYLGKPLGEWADSYGSKATQEKHFIGKVVNYFEKAKAVEILIQSEQLKIGDHIIIIGPTSGTIRTKVEKILLDDKELATANKDDDITIELKEKVRKNDQVYVIKKKN